MAHRLDELVLFGSEYQTALQVLAVAVAFARAIALSFSGGALFSQAIHATRCMNRLFSKGLRSAETACNRQSDRENTVTVRGQTSLSLSSMEPLRGGFLASQRSRLMKLGAVFMSSGSIGPSASQFGTPRYVWHVSRFDAELQDAALSCCLLRPA